MVSAKGIFGRVASCVLSAILAFGVATPSTLAAANSQPVLSAQSVSATRLAGTDRYATMAEIVQEAFPGTSTWAVVATGEGFADALCASALAGARRCPVVLCANGSLPTAAKAELERLKVRNVYVVGGTAVIKPSVEASISDMGISVTRLSGTDRYATSVAVAREVRALGGSGSVAVATGADFADALSLGPWCYATVSPVICVPKGGSLSFEALSEIASGGYANAVIAGGKAAVSTAVETQLGRLRVERLSGTDRYDTSTKVAEWSCKHGLSWKSPAIATGKNFPDALAGAALAGTLSSPLLLAGKADSTASTISAHGAEVARINILGGTGAVSEAFVTAITGKSDPRDKARSVADKLIEGEHSRQLSTYRFADVYGDADEELLLNIKSEAGSGWNLYIYTFEGGTRMLYKDAGIPDKSYEFYKETSSFVAYGAGHGSEWYKAATMVDGIYQDCASKARNPSIAGGGAQDGAWVYTTRGSASDAATYEAAVAKLTKGAAIRVKNSGDEAWENLY